MWIRSQDKFRITNGEITYKVWGCTATCWKIYLVNENNSNEEKEVIEVARYSSKAKALKVLDLLEKHINNKLNNFVIKDTENLNTPYTIENYFNIVFQFPQDEEIK